MTFLQHLKQFGIAVDQLVNTLLGGFADESLSARSHRVAKKGYWYAEAMEWFINLLFRPFQSDHCRKAYISEVENRQLPPEYRK